MTKEQALRLKPGDKIRCIDDDPLRTSFGFSSTKSGLIKNNKYVFLSLANGDNADDIRIRIIERPGHIYYLYRFDIISIKQIEII